MNEVPVYTDIQVDLCIVHISYINESQTCHPFNNVFA